MECIERKKKSTEEARWKTNEGKEERRNTNARAETFCLEFVTLCKYCSTHN